MTTCKYNGCSNPTHKGSSYCKEHRKAAREAWKALIAEQAAEREERYSLFTKLWADAHNAGLAAIKEHVCTPMGVVDPDKGLVEVVRHGMCGYASLVITPGNSSLAKWAAKFHEFSKHYYGGVARGVRWHPSEVGLEGTAWQSYELNRAYAEAFSKVFNDAGFSMSVWARLD